MTTLKQESTVWRTALRRARESKHWNPLFAADLAVKIWQKRERVERRAKRRRQKLARRRNRD